MAALHSLCPVGKTVLLDCALCICRKALSNPKNPVPHSAPNMLNFSKSLYTTSPCVEEASPLFTVQKIYFEFFRNMYPLQDSNQFICFVRSRTLLDYILKLDIKAT